MAYDEGLAQRLRECLQEQDSVVEKKMFGGLCFMVNSHMCCGIVDDILMARVGPAQYEVSLAQKFVSEMDFTGKPMKGLIYVSPEGLESDDELFSWVDCCLNFVMSLPPKK